MVVAVEVRGAVAGKGLCREDEPEHRVLLGVWTHPTCPTLTMHEGAVWVQPRRRASPAAALTRSERGTGARPARAHSRRARPVPGVVRPTVHGAHAPVNPMPLTSLASLIAALAVVDLRRTCADQTVQERWTLDDVRAPEDLLSKE